MSSFLDNVRRLAAPDYTPSTGRSASLLTRNQSENKNVDSEDILNVRLQTLGVIEQSFDIKLSGNSYNWRMYDVGGAVCAFSKFLHPRQFH